MISHAKANFTDRGPKEVRQSKRWTRFDLEYNISVKNSHDYILKLVKS